MIVHRWVKVHPEPEGQSSAGTDSRLVAVGREPWRYHHGIGQFPSELGEVLVIPSRNCLDLHLLDGLRHITRLEGHIDRVRSVDTCVVEGRHYLISGSSTSVRVWDTAEVLREYSGDDSGGRAVDVLASHPTGVVAAHRDGTLVVFDPATGTGRVSSPDEAERLFQDVSTTREHLLAVVDNRLASAPLSRLDLLEPWEGPDDQNGVASTTVDGRLVVATCGVDGTITLWDAESKKPTGARLVEEHWEDKRLLHVAFTASSPRLVLAAGSNRHVVAWDLAAALRGTATEIDLPWLHTDYVQDLAVFTHPFGELVVTVGHDGCIAVIDPITEHNWRRDDAHNDWITATTVIQSDPPVITTASKDGYVGLWTLHKEGLTNIAMISVGSWVNSLRAIDDTLVVGTDAGIVALEIAPLR
ncbi:WD40 repeat domain-containing protein [Amycolatopsis sp. NPDC051758]|uniref:WD40 repeat domain-containing protein n=1 Tax=Amycolatopsis sp. NPDC051758 TaxID=3363935 RepID=UPI0037A7E49D